MLAGPHQQEIFLEQRDLGQRGLGYRQRHDRGVEPAFGDFLDQLRRQRLADVNIELGMQAREIFDDLRQQIGRDRRNHADAQPSGQPVARGAREVAEFIDRTQDVADPLQQFFAEFRQRDLPRATFEQHTAERFPPFP